MSNWSYCNAIILVSSYKELPDFEKIIESMIEQAPPITGSEGNCSIHVVDYFRNVSTSMDCRRCPHLNLQYGLSFDDGSIDRKGCPGAPLATARHRKMCVSGEYIGSCKVVITDNNGLRDKTKEETIKEFKDFIKHMKSYRNKLFDITVICKNIE